MRSHSFGNEGVKSLLQGFLYSPESMSAVGSQTCHRFASTFLTVAVRSACSTQRTAGSYRKRKQAGLGSGTDQSFYASGLKPQGAEPKPPFGRESGPYHSNLCQAPVGPPVLVMKAPSEWLQLCEAVSTPVSSLLSWFCTTPGSAEGLLLAGLGNHIGCWG